MELIRSNRTETLADALASRVRDEPLLPFEKEAIVVQSKGVESWLTLELARRLGIWANPSFPFPRAAIEQVLAGFEEGADDDAKAYDRSRLKWTLAGLLSKSPPDELETYLGSPADPDRVLRLATSVANVFDDYVVYRPSLLESWMGGESDGWEAKLWRRLVGELGPHDLSSRMARALPRLRSADAATELCFRRLHLFSLETLPPSFLRFFGELSILVPTTLYVLEPSAQYQGDVAQAAAEQLSLPTEQSTPDGHPFLVGAGRLARDFQQLLLDASDTIHRELEAFVEPDSSTLLGFVQSDIFEFKAAPPSAERVPIPRTDDSISVHSCTGPLREVQVLHDLLRGALEDDSTLRPEDIVVMAPDLDTYAPLFRAVFGQETEHRIPFEVHDRRSREDTAFYDDFSLALETLDSRFSVLDLVRLMDAKSMREAFCFSSEERARLADLFAAAGVRWGIDGAHREAEGFPNEDLHTWRAGLGRLFLGFASMPDTTQVFGDLLPRGAPTLDDITLVARVSQLCEIMFEFQQRTRRALTLDRWANELGQLCTRLFSDEDESSRAVYLLRTALADLRDSAARTSFDEALSLRTVRRELGGILVDKTPALGFLRRGLTLSELVPLRSVPFRVVCLIGMSEDEFPRADDRPSFHRARREHQAGDRNRRNDDRHSFLQALLCARDRFIVTFSAPARSLRVAANPSPLVWELGETINRYYRANADHDPLLQWTSHPLHAFDRRYFTGESLPRSFSSQALEVAQTLERGSVERPRVELHAEVAEESTSVSVGELTKWLWNPSRAFLDQVLRARFDTTELYAPSGALTEVGKLEAANLGNSALAANLRGDALSEYLRAVPEFPDGTPGTIERRRMHGELEAIWGRSQALRAGTESSSAFLRVPLGETIVEGRIAGVGQGKRVLERFTRLGHKAELAAWVEHLLMQATAEPELPTETHLVLRGSKADVAVVSYRSVDIPAAHLSRLLELYRTSLREPLPLLEKASYEYVSKLLAAGPDKGPQKGIQAARSAYSKERAWDSRLRYVFGKDNPFDDPAWVELFTQAAEAVYRPLFEHRSES